MPSGPSIPGSLPPGVGGERFIAPSVHEGPGDVDILYAHHLLGNNSLAGGRKNHGVTDLLF